MAVRKNPGARWYVGCVATVVGAALTAACGTAPAPGRRLAEITSCGTVLYSGYAEILPTPISPPTPQDRATAPAPATALPPAADDQNQATRAVVLEFTANCDRGDQVSVAPLDAARTGAVAHSRNDGISGLTLDIPASESRVPVTVYDYRGGRLVGVVHA